MPTVPGSPLIPGGTTHQWLREEIPEMVLLGPVFNEKRFSDLGVLFCSLIRGEAGIPIPYGRGGEENR